MKHEKDYLNFDPATIGAIVAGLGSAGVQAVDASKKREYRTQTTENISPNLFSIFSFRLHNNSSYAKLNKIPCIFLLPRLVLH